MRAFFDGERKLSTRLSPARDLRQAVRGGDRRRLHGRRLRTGARLPLSHRRPTPRRPGVGLPEIKVGLFPGGGGTQRVARLMPTPDALQMLFKGDQI